MSTEATGDGSPEAVDAAEPAAGAAAEPAVDQSGEPDGSGEPDEPGEPGDDYGEYADEAAPESIVDDESLEYDEPRRSP